MAGMHQSQITRFESGERSLTEEHLWKIAGALGWSPERFFSTDSNVVETNTETRRVPLLAYEQASHWESLQNAPVGATDRDSVSVSIATPVSSFALRVRGNSMEPLFLAGDMIVIAPTIPPKPGDYVVATDAHGETTFRKYREVHVDENGGKVIELIPLNQDYPSIRSDRQRITIIGKMIRQMRDYHSL